MVTPAIGHTLCIVATSVVALVSDEKVACLGARALKTGE